MNLKEFQEKWGIKRINFDKIDIDEDLDEEFGSDSLVCPYCGYEYNYESEDIDDVLKGSAFQCPECEMWFYAEGEATINTYCKPMEQAVLDNKRNIQDTYDHVDKCEELGTEWGDRYGNVEWETYKAYARPLFENEERRGSK